MLCVLNETVLLSTQNICKKLWVRKHLQFYAEIFCLIFTYVSGYDGYWDWRASTLNPYYEGNGSGQMINDDRFIRHTEHNWTFGAGDTGDLMCPLNLEKMKSQGELAKIDLVQ